MKTFVRNWTKMGGGYFLAGPARESIGIRLFHRFKKWGVAMVGEEREFIVRGEASLSIEPVRSWFMMQVMDLDEACPLYLWIRLWGRWSLKIVFNLGARLTKESRGFRAEQARKAMLEATRKAYDEQVKARKMKRQVDLANLRRGFSSIKLKGA